MLALIAGTGDLPTVIHRQLVALNTPVVVCAMDGFQPQLDPETTFRFEQLGSFLRTLVERGVSQVCMAGAVRRPRIDPQKIDKETLPLIPTLQSAMALGDDGTLRGVIAVIESFGLQVVAASDLVPELLPAAGIPTQTSPTFDHRVDAKEGDRILRDMGKADTGQACVVRSGAMVAQEGSDGTDAMLRRLAPSDPSDHGFAPFDIMDAAVSSAADWLTGQAGRAEGGILFKGPKPNQDRRADLPVIGLDTVMNARSAKLAGIVITAGGVMVLDLEDVIAALDDAGMFLWVRE